MRAYVDLQAMRVVCNELPHLPIASFFNCTYLICLFTHRILQQNAFHHNIPSSPPFSPRKRTFPANDFQVSEKLPILYPITIITIHHHRSSILLDTFSLCHNINLPLNLRCMIRIHQILNTCPTITPSTLTTITPFIQT